MLAIDQNTVPIEGDCVRAKFPSSCLHGVSPTLYRGFAASSVANVGCEVVTSFVWRNPLKLDVDLAEALGVVE